MRRFKRICLILAILFLGLGLWAAYYAYDRGLTQRWRGYVHAEFRKRGVEAHVGKLTLDPFKGLVARDVRFFSDATQRDLLTEIDKISLDIDLLKLVRQEFFLSTIDVRDARVSLPIDPEDADSERLVIEDFNARLLMPDERIEISQAYGNMHGVHVNLRGSLFKSESKKEDDKSNEEKNRERKEETLALLKKQRTAIHTILTELNQLEHPPGETPVLSLEVNGDLDNLHHLSARVHFTAKGLRRGDYASEELEAVLELKRSVVTLNEFRLVDGTGEVTAQAEFTIGEPLVNFQLQSSLDLHALATAFMGKRLLGEVVFYEPPKLFVEGEYRLDHPKDSTTLPVSLVGSFQCNSFVTRGTVFTGFDGDFGVKPGQYYLRELKLSHESGTVVGTILADEENVQYEGELKMDPSVFAPFAPDEETRIFLGQCGFDEGATLYVAFHGSGRRDDLLNWHTIQEVDARNFKFNSVPFERIQLNSEMKGRQQVHRDIVVRRPEGILTADYMHNDLDTRIVTIKNLRSNVWIQDVLQAVAPDAVEAFAPYHFSSPPTFEGWGIIDPVNFAQTDFHARFSSEGTMKYEVAGQTLPFENVAGSLHYLGETLAQGRAEGGLYGGNVITQFAINNLYTDVDYAVALDVKSVRFRDLSIKYGDYESTDGQLTGYLDFTGHGENPATISGKGRAVILNGNIFSIPLLGPLSGLMSDMFKKEEAGHTVAREASASFTLANGVAATNDFEALTKAFRLTGQGKVDFINDQVDMLVRMNAKGATGLVLLPVSKLLEFRGRGPMANTAWDSRTIEVAGGVAGEVAGGAVGVAGGAVDAAGSVVGKAGETVLRAGESVTRAAGGLLERAVNAAMGRSGNRSDDRQQKR